jgi:hypothetical protein
MKGRRMKTQGQSAFAVLALALLIAVMPVAAQERVDLIILLDSSRSMFRYYNQVIDFVVSDAVREYLRFGDGFHLMNFADTTQLEVAQVLRTEEDVRTVLSRLYLMYPLGRNTDMISALKGVSQYVSGLASSSSKYIIFITDGMHSPAPGSLYAAYSTDEARAEMERSASRIRERGWTMRIVQVPFNGADRSDFSAVESVPSDGTAQSGGASSGTVQSAAPATGSSTQATTTSTAGNEYELLSDAPGTGDYTADIASALGTSILTFDPENAGSTLSDMVDILKVSFPGEIATRRPDFKIRIGIENLGERHIPFELEALVLPDGTDILASRAITDLGPGKAIQFEIDVRLPDSFPEGTSVLIVEPRLANDVRVSPATSIMTVELNIPAFAAFFRNTASILVFILILIATLTIVILLTRYIRDVHRRAEEPVLQAFMSSSEARNDEHRIQSNMQTNSRMPAAQASGLAGPSVFHTTASVASAIPRSTVESWASVSASGTALDQYRTTGPTSAKAGKLDLSRRIEPGSNLHPEEDRSRLLDQWTQGDRNRYTLPLKTAVEKGRKKVSGEAIGNYTYTPAVTKPGTLRVELRVRNQNPFIGSRNIKTLHSGGHKTIGGKSSDFLVFLLPVPKRIADIHYDGQNITIVPVRPAYFPDYQGPIAASMGEEIRIVNDRGNELFLCFERYVSPLEKLNKLLHCIEVPGVTPATDEIPQA